MKEDRRRKTDDGRQRADDREQMKMTDGRRQNAEKKEGERMKRWGKE